MKKRRFFWENPGPADADPAPGDACRTRDVIIEIIQELEQVVFPGYLGTTVWRECSRIITWDSG